MVTNTDPLPGTRTAHGNLSGVGASAPFGHGGQRRVHWIDCIPGRIGLALVLVSCFPCVLLSLEPPMEIFVDLRKYGDFQHITANR